MRDLQGSDAIKMAKATSGVSGVKSHPNARRTVIPSKISEELKLEVGDILLWETQLDGSVNVKKI